MDVAAWLEGLGLERYVPAFRDNEIDARVLPSLTAEDLKDLGVTLVGHRRRLLDAIAALGAEGPPAVTAGSRDAPAQADAELRQLTVMFCELCLRRYDRPRVRDRRRAVVTCPYPFGRRRLPFRIRLDRL